MKQNNMLAMILAGGRGSRLHELTNKVAKPAVSYGGKYRIVDFPLSNCANSGIDVVGVLTQYESILLNSYVAAGRRWGLDAQDSGVYVLPPREKADANLDVYRGTADAISQNIDFIDSFSPEYVLILSGDHIYKMNYAKMLSYHKEHQADATIAVIEVPMKEASRFGIMNTDESCTHINTRVTGKMWEPLIHCGKPIWISWTRIMSWISMIPPGRFTRKTDIPFLIMSGRTPISTALSSHRAARSTAR